MLSYTSRLRVRDCEASACRILTAYSIRACARTAMTQRPKPIAQYRGPLSAQQIADGMNGAARNAKRLLEDAITLIKAGRFPTACSVAILSIEESGKLPVLRALAGV